MISRYLQNAFQRFGFVQNPPAPQAPPSVVHCTALQTGSLKVQNGKTTIGEPEFDAGIDRNSLLERQSNRRNIWQRFFSADRHFVRSKSNTKKTMPGL